MIGVDYHPSVQQIAFTDTETGEFGERRLNHSDGEAGKFYRDLKQRGISVRVGIEATGYSRWFERLLVELGFEVWIGNASGNKDPASEETKDRPRRCSSVAEAAAGKSLSSNLGAESRESGPSTVAVASASVGSDADQDHDSAAGHRHERRETMEEEAVERARSGRAGEIPVSALGQQAPARLNGIVEPIESHHRGINHSRSSGLRSDSNAASRSAAT